MNSRCVLSSLFFACLCTNFVFAQNEPIDPAKNEAQWREMLAELEDDNNATALLNQLNGEWIAYTVTVRGEEMKPGLAILPDRFSVTNGVGQFYYPPSSVGRIPSKMRDDYCRPYIAVAFHEALNAIEFRKTITRRSDPKDSNSEWILEVKRCLMAIRDGELLKVSTYEKGTLPSTLDASPENFVLISKRMEITDFDFEDLSYEFDIASHVFLQTFEGEWEFEAPDIDDGGPAFPIRGSLTFTDNELVLDPEPDRWRTAGSRGRIDTQESWRVIAVDKQNQKAFLVFPWKNHMYWYVLQSSPDATDPKQKSWQLVRLGVHDKDRPRNFTLEPPKVHAHHIRLWRNE